MPRLLPGLLLLLATLSGCDPDPAWTTSYGPNKNAALLSVWAQGKDDAWAVGGCTCPGKPHALVLRKQGATWTELASPADVTLWWVHGFSSSDVWIAGEQGTVLHWDGSALAKVPTEAGADVKLFGIWGAKPGDLWAAGGSPDVSSTVLRYDGSKFVKVADAPQATDGKLGGTWFKVWGSGPSDVWLVGQAGSVARWNGSAWARQDLSGVGITNRDGLFTASGSSPNDVYVVGGQNTQGAALRWNGSAWSKVAGLSLDGVGLLTGVSVTPAGEVVIAGMDSAKFVGRDGSFRDDKALGGRADWHAAFALSSEQIFLAGGNYFAQTSGVIGWFGR